MILAPKLFQRTLLIAIIPLLFHVGFVSWLFFCWWQTQSQLIQLWHTRDKVSDLNLAAWKTIDGVYNAFINSATLGLADPGTMSIEAAKFKSRLIDLIAQPWESNEIAYVEKIQTAGLSMLKKLEIIRQEQSRGLKHWDKVKNTGFCHDLVYYPVLAFIESTQNLSLLEESKLKSGPGALQVQKDRIGAALLFAIPANLLLSLFLGGLYIISIRNPLMRIAENARFLSRRHQLLPPLQGQDELSTLDHLLHRVDESIDHALQVEKSMLANTVNMICSISDDWIITNINPYGQKFLGIEQETLIGKIIFDFIFNEDCACAHREMGNARETSQIAEFGLRMTKSNGTIIDTWWSVFWSANQHSFFCVVRDISEQSKLERLKQEFVTMISDDLRNPLLAMHASMSLILDDSEEPLSQLVRKDIERAQANTTRLMRLVGDLLDLQQLQSGKIKFEFEGLQLENLIDEVVEMVESVAAENSVTIKVPDGHWAIQGDRQRLMQTLLNLLTNAIKYSPSNSTIIINVKQTDNYLEVSVSDEGQGVPAEFRAKIFEIFQQAPGAEGISGSGLGLAICKLVIGAHQGQIGVRDTETGNGSTFWFSLPNTASI